MKAETTIFLSYTKKDKSKVLQIYKKLTAEGFKPWMDEKDIFVGEKWNYAIKRALREADFILICLSKNSVNKRGYIQKEIKIALDIGLEKLDEDIFLLPVRLEDCEIPSSLRDFQVMDLYKRDGWKRLVDAIKTGIKRLS